MVSTVLVIGVVLFAMTLFWLARKFPNPSKLHPGAVRMPLFVPIFGWLIIAAGLMMAAVAFTVGSSDGADQTLAMRIAAVGMILFGSLLLGMYRNFWVAINDTDIYYRGVFTRRLKHIVVAHITRVDAVRMNGALMATFVSPDEKFTLNISAYNAEPALLELERLNVPMADLIRPGRRQS